MYKKKNGSYRILVLVVAFVLAFSVVSFASSADENSVVGDKLSLEQAKNYLTSYCETSINEDGKEIETKYDFDNEEDLNDVAAYIAEYGLDKFNSELDVALRNAVKQEETSMIQTRATTPSTGHAKISTSNGTHTAKILASGLVKFNKVGNVEYSIDMSYDVVVKSKKFKSINNMKFDIPYLSTGGSWGGLSLSPYVTDKSAGVTANYKITKKLNVPVGSIDVPLRSETKADLFALLASF